MSPERPISKYDPGAEIHTEDVLCLHRNENLFISPSWSVDAARDLVEEARIATYPDPQCTELREELAKLYGVGVGNVFLGNGADEVIADLLALLRLRYDTLWLTDVCFKVFLMLADRLDFGTATLPGRTFVTGKIDPKGWSGLALVDSPNAITGLSQPRETLSELAAGEGSFLIWDNVYGEFAGDEIPRDVPENLAIVRSFSKFYGLAGLRIGYCIAGESIVSDLLARKDVFNVNSLAQRMAVAGLRRRDEFDRITTEIRRCRELMTERLLALGFELRQPSSAHYVLVRHPDLKAEHVQRRLLEHGIAVRRFEGEPTGDHVRITVPPERGIDQLHRALEGILNGASAGKAPETGRGGQPG
ncbi:MAG TPA: histidinol-phosphate transaminase [bacterium]|nr:histidinol-phosphate transaminase [bacterium]